MSFSHHDRSELNSYCPEEIPSKTSTLPLKTFQFAEKRNFSKFHEIQTGHSTYSHNFSPRFAHTQSFASNLEVFDRLIEDANKRSERSLKITDFLRVAEEKAIPVFKENEEVYQRLLKDTELRREIMQGKEKFKKVLEDAEVSSYQCKNKFTKSQTEAVITRLLSTF